MQAPPTLASLLLRTLVAVLFTIAIGIALSFCSFAYVALGGDPSTTQPAEALIPYLALFLAAMLLTRRPSSHQSSTWPFVSLATTAFFIATWFWYRSYKVARYDPALWWSEGIRGLGPADLLAWALAFPSTLAGAAWSVRLGKFNHRPRRIACVAPSLLALAAIICLQMIAASSRLAREGPYGVPNTIARGVTLTSEPIPPDGTIIRLIACDLAANPGIRLRLYDCAVDAPNPDDDNNSPH